MGRLTYRRAEWVAVVREVSERYHDTAPPGLIGRIEALLHETPAQWADQLCALELDTASADVVQAVVAQLHEQRAISGETTQSASAVTDAADIIRDHHRRRHSLIYRVEHRTGAETTVIARTSDAHARQAELSQHAARLMAAGATGELVLVEETTGDEVARRSLRPEDPPPPDTAPS